MPYSKCKWYWKLFCSDTVHYPYELRCFVQLKNMTFVYKKTTLKQSLFFSYNLNFLKCQSWEFMHWNTFKQDNYSTVRGDGGCRVGEVRAGTTSPIPNHKGFLSCSNCQEIHPLHFQVNLHKLSTVRVNTIPYLCTNPSSKLCNTWALKRMSLVSCGVESTHCPFMMGRSNMLQNSVFVPRKLGRVKSTIHQYSSRLFCRG